MESYIYVVKVIYTVGQDWQECQRGISKSVKKVVQHSDLLVLIKLKADQCMQWT